MGFFTQKKFSEWAPQMAARGPVLAAVEQRSFHSFFIVLVACLKGLRNFGLWLQFNIIYNIVWLEAAAESGIWLVTSKHMMQTDVHYTRCIKFHFLPRTLYTHQWCCMELKAAVRFLWPRIFKGWMSIWLPF